MTVSTPAGTGARSAVEPAGRGPALVMAGSALLFLGAATIFAWSLSHWSDTPREVVASPAEVIGCSLATIGAVLLVLNLPSVLTDLPAWAVTTTVAGLVFVVVDAWANGTLAVAVAQEVDETTYEAIITSWLAFVMTVPKIVLCTVGLVAVGVLGRRHHAFGTGLLVLYVLAGVSAIVPPFMPLGVVGSAAFFCTALLRRSER